MNQLRDSSEQLIGEIRLFAFDFAPDGWMPCEGQIVPKNEENEPLFSVIGTLFGGDGFTTFGLPNLNLNSNLPVGEAVLPGVLPMRDKGIHYCIAVQGVHPSRETSSVDCCPGQINLFPYEFVPGGWLPCDGRILNVISDQLLFRRIKNKFGGDGQNNFALPNLQGAELLQQIRYYIFDQIGRPSNYLGEINFFPFAPDGWLPCDGRMLDIASYNVLVSLIGNKFGGDGQTKFALPNLLGAEPLLNTGFYICVDGEYPVK